MTQPWDEQLMWAKYNNSVVQRLFENFTNYEDKNFLTSTITQAAKSASNLINAHLIHLNIKHKIKIPKSPEERLKLFQENKNINLNDKTKETLLQILKIKKAQKESPIQFLKQDKILLLDGHQYKILTHKKLKELIMMLDETVKNF